MACSLTARLPLLLSSSGRCRASLLADIRHPASFTCAYSRSQSLARRSRLQVTAKKDSSEQLQGLVDTGNRLADSAANLVPGSVPRPIAKTGVVAVSGLVAFWLVQQVLSTVFTFAVLGGAVFLWYKLSNKDDDSSGGDSGDDPLSEAQRIFQKYK